MNKACENEQLRNHALDAANAYIMHRLANPLQLTPNTSQEQNMLVMEVIEDQYPEYNFSRYGDYGGYLMGNVFYIKNTLILCLGSYLLPAITLYWRYRILKRLNDKSFGYSMKTMKQTRLLTMVSIVFS